MGKCKPEVVYPGWEGDPARIWEHEETYASFNDQNLVNYGNGKFPTDIRFGGGMQDGFEYNVFIGELNLRRQIAMMKGDKEAHKILCEYPGGKFREWGEITPCTNIQ